MSVLQNIPNVKIPYPTEGVIRTAQLDDTVAPQDSVQLAVNMNFDRVGALQTRPGITQYADDLVNAINNYGTLRNSIVPPGFDQIFQLGSTNNLEDSSFSSPSAVKISNTKIAVFWTALNGHGFCRNFSLDETTGSVSPIGSSVEFYSGPTAQNIACLVGSSTVLNVWSTTSDVAYVAAFDVSADTIVVGTPLNFQNGVTNFTMSQVDGSHAICFSSVVASGHLLGTIFAVSTLTITQPGSTLDISIVSQQSACVAVGDGTHFINFWSSTSDSLAQCFSVNTGTWGITAIGTPLTFAANIGHEHNPFSMGDGSHFVDIYKANFSQLAGQVIALNLSTYAVTSVGTPLAGSTVQGGLSAASLNDGFHFIAFYSTPVGTGFAQMVGITASTFIVTEVGSPVSGYNFGDEGSISAFSLTGAKAMAVWDGYTDDSGYAAAFISLGNVINGRFLYAGSGTEVFNRTTGAWTSRRSGLSTVSKPRFVQYLNYIWMVNGNPQIGGNDIATSKGGAFGTDLIPQDFTGGDFISAGFEGRVWVANKTLGVIYYTDIVQFIPPSTYLLTYNSSVNFISQFVPQTGQQITALFQVPRALLVFTEDSIFRIYGATSVDAYPAYNVGTYSQESIIQTKTGIFFHHSSGFYQFDYGSQPVEISRRIIDFVQAIPRTYYENITGVWDGFDNVEWSVGPVTVEGVVFTNCVVRYTISTQVWTIYDYPLNAITAMIQYDDGTKLNHLAGVTNTVTTAANKTGALDFGNTDFGEPFYFEFIDRWRPFTDMYYQTKQLSGLNVYSENAAGANLSYQVQKSGPNAWEPLGTVDEDNNSLMPNAQTENFDVLRLRLAGNTKGVQVVVHGIEILSLNIIGQDEN